VKIDVRLRLFYGSEKHTIETIDSVTLYILESKNNPRIVEYAPTFVNPRLR